MRTIDDPLHPANVRERAWKRICDETGRCFREMLLIGHHTNAAPTLAGASKDAVAEAFEAGVEYAKKAIAKGAKPRRMAANALWKSTIHGCEHDEDNDCKSKWSPCQPVPEPQPRADVPR